MAIPQNALTIWTDLISAGASPIQAAGALGNVNTESGGNPEARNSSGHVGLFQWDPRYYPTAPSLLTGNVAQDIKAQVALFVQTGGLTAAGNTTDPSTAALNIQNNYERCGDSTACGTPSRLQAAKDVFQAATSGAWPAGASTPSSATGDAATMQATDTGSSGGICQLHIASFCAWEAGWTRALLGGLLLASAGVVALVGLGSLVGKEIAPTFIPGVKQVRSLL